MILNLLMTCLVLAGVEAMAAEKMLQGSSLVYVEQGESDEASLTTRFFVNKQYLYIRESFSPDDFILFDRNQQTVYIVTTSEKTIFVIRPKAVNISPPMVLDFKEKLDPVAQLPSVDGQKVRQYRYSAAGELCYVASVLPEGFLAEAAQAMYEFKQVMAGEHATTLDTVPKSMLTPCDLALNVFHAGAYFKHGVTVHESAPGGYQRFLKDYQLESSLPAANVVLPEGYERFSIGDVLSDAEQ